MDPHREIFGIPLWLHGLLTVFTFGLWLIILPFMMLFEQIERAVGWVVGGVLKGLWVVVTAPLRLVAAGWRAVRGT